VHSSDDEFIDNSDIINDNTRPRADARCNLLSPPTRKQLLKPLRSLRTRSFCSMFLGAANNRGHAVAQFSAGLLYDNGQGVKAGLYKDSEVASKSSLSRKCKGPILFGHHVCERPRNQTGLKEAVKWYRQAADKGYANAG